PPHPHRQSAQVPAPGKSVQSATFPATFVSTDVHALAAASIGQAVFERPCARPIPIGAPTPLKRQLLPICALFLESSSLPVSFSPFGPIFGKFQRNSAEFATL